MKEVSINVKNRVTDCVKGDFVGGNTYVVNVGTDEEWIGKTVSCRIIVGYEYTDYPVIDGKATVYIPPNVDTVGIGIHTDNISSSIADVKVMRSVLDTHEEYKQSGLDGYKVSILGDSISTFEGWLPYDSKGEPYLSKYPFGDVQDVGQTWWMQTIKALGLTLCKNNSYSGSKVTGNSVTSTAGCSERRLGNLFDSGYEPDIVIIEMGRNDCTTGKEIGTWDGEALPTVTPTDINTFSDAYATMIYRIKKALPKAYIVTLGIFSRSDRTYPEAYAGVEYYKYNEVIENVSKKMGTFYFDLSPLFAPEYGSFYCSGDRIHPNAEGMKRIAGKVINELKHIIPKRL